MSPQASVAALGNGLVEDDARTTSRSALVDVKAVAAYLDVESGWVYEHQDELGVRRLGSGPRPRLRFSLEEVDERLTACSVGRESSSGTDAEISAPQAGSGAGTRHRRRQRSGTSVDLLPIRGQITARRGARVDG